MLSFLSSTVAPWFGLVVLYLRAPLHPVQLLKITVAQDHHATKFFAIAPFPSL
jgi:hypothetical protein